MNVAKKSNNTIFDADAEDLSRFGGSKESLVIQYIGEIYGERAKARATKVFSRIRKEGLAMSAETLYNLLDGIIDDDDIEEIANFLV